MRNVSSVVEPLQLVPGGGNHGCHHVEHRKEFASKRRYRSSIWTARHKKDNRRRGVLPPSNVREEEEAALSAGRD